MGKGTHNQETLLKKVIPTAAGAADLSGLMVWKCWIYNVRGNGADGAFLTKSLFAKKKIKKNQS